jgi:glutamate/tyrosine decarboxylase-like PLP-dependent enzyme
VSSRRAPIDLGPEEFRRLGHRLVDQIAEMLDSLPRHPVTPGESADQVRAALGRGGLPEEGTSPDRILEEAFTLLRDHSLFNGHPRFWGYITASPAPIGILAEMLAAAVNPNVGAWDLSPMASEIEAQSIGWIAELIGFPGNSGGILVSGGNMANIVAFLAARTHQAGTTIRDEGLRAKPDLVTYVSKDGHTWIQKAADMCGLGTRSIRWVDVDRERRMKPDALARMIEEDVAAGLTPFLVTGTAGTVAVGAVDPLAAIGRICRERGLWFHVDGAYGAPAACLPDASADLKALAGADSVALDPHKWLYSPLEAGCTLIRDPERLQAAFDFHPSYYAFRKQEGDPPINYLNLGPQNSRGFRALKVWAALRMVGAQGYRKMIADDIELARVLHEAAAAHPELEAWTLSLSISTFRYVPEDLRGNIEGRSHAETGPYLDALNREILSRLQAGGEAFVSTAVIDGRFLLRACIVNFRTSQEDVGALPEIVVRLGRSVDAELRPAALR